MQELFKIAGLVEKFEEVLIEKGFSGSRCSIRSLSMRGVRRKKRAPDLPNFRQGHLIQSDAS